MQLDASDLSHRIAALPSAKRRVVMRGLIERKIDLDGLPLVPMSRDAAIPLSHAQRALWLTWCLEPDSAAYNLSGVVELLGELSKDELVAALYELAGRQQVLRTVFGKDEHGEPIQRLVDWDPGFVRYEDVSDSSVRLRTRRSTSKRDRPVASS